MTDIKWVAKYFLSKESMTHKKLQKLCYYAQAWYLANSGKALMPNSFEAWIHGPVSPDLYVKYKDNGWTNIRRVSASVVKDKLTDAQKELLDNVYNVYGCLSGDQLEALTHNEDPWVNARSGCRPSQYSRNVIANEAMRKYYGKRIGKNYD